MCLLLFFLTLLSAGWDADLLKNLASEVQLLRGLGTWTSQSEKVVGRNLLSESVLVPRLLQDISLPPLPPQPLFDIISKHFGALIEAAGEAKLQEAKVQKIYSRFELKKCSECPFLLFPADPLIPSFSSLFKELIAEVSKASSKVYPCFQVHDTSTSGHLKNPIAKVSLVIVMSAT